MIISIDDPDGLAVLEALPADVKSHTVAYGTTARESLPDLGGAAYVWIASESETAGSGVEQLTLHLPAAGDGGGSRCLRALPEGSWRAQCAQCGRRHQRCRAAWA